MVTMPEMPAKVRATMVNNYLQIAREALKRAEEEASLLEGEDPQATFAKAKRIQHIQTALGRTIVAQVYHRNNPKEA